MQWQLRIGSRQRQKALQRGEGEGGTSSGELAASGGGVAKKMWWVWKRRPVPHQCQKRESLLAGGLSMGAQPIAPWWSREDLWPSPSPSLMLNPNLNPSSRLY